MKIKKIFAKNRKFLCYERGARYNVARYIVILIVPDSQEKGFDQWNDERLPIPKKKN